MKVMAQGHGRRGLVCSGLRDQEGLRVADGGIRVVRHVRNDTSFLMKMMNSKMNQEVASLFVSSLGEEFEVKKRRL
jgi:hypothetical protein